MEGAGEEMEEGRGRGGEGGGQVRLLYLLNSADLSRIIISVNRSSTLNKH
jgi:hypothetical protein